MQLGCPMGSGSDLVLLGSRGRVGPTKGPGLQSPSSDLLKGSKMLTSACEVAPLCQVHCVDELINSQVDGVRQVVMSRLRGEGVDAQRCLLGDGKRG